VIHHLGAVDSTQRVAREAAASGAVHGAAFVAASQSAGRGRLGRAWHSEPGENLLMSIVLRPNVPVAEAPLLSLGAAAGLALAFDLAVKWPNDLVTRDGQKVGGLLAELDARGDRVGFVVLGLGLNLNQGAFPGLLATSLRQRWVSGAFEPDELVDGDRLHVGRVAERARAAILAWSTHPARLDEWRRRAHTLGRRVRIGEVEGVAERLRDDGALVVGGQAVLTGDVELVAPLA
jgi:BirA family biotin operon repressor/biotin-[acetyl-CoA-carboxylase] ligase